MPEFLMKILYYLINNQCFIRLPTDLTGQVNGTVF
jgi:hypothetical protein